MVVRVAAGVAAVCLIVVFSGLRGLLAAYWGIGTEYVGLALALAVLVTGAGLAAIAHGLNLRRVGVSA